MKTLTVLSVILLMITVSCKKETKHVQDFPSDKVLWNLENDATAAARGKKPHPPKGGGKPVDTIPEEPPTQDGATCIYLDHDGENVSGIWGTFYAAPSGMSLSQQESVALQVRNYYSAPGITKAVVVTNSLQTFLSYPITKRMWLILTNNTTLYPGTGGVAYINSYLWGNDTPAFVFPNRYGYNTDWISYACAHEAGHMVGEYHQHVVDEFCNILYEYKPGCIMGTYNGSAAWTISCTQNDFVILNNNL